MSDGDFILQNTQLEVIYPFEQEVQQIKSVHQEMCNFLKQYNVTNMLIGVNIEQPVNNKARIFVLIEEYVLYQSVISS